jgi:hypothetical protein
MLISSGSMRRHALMERMMPDAVKKDLLEHPAGPR